MNSWVLELFLWLNGVMFAIAFGTYLKRSLMNDSEQ